MAKISDVAEELPPQADKDTVSAAAAAQRKTRFIAGLFS
jgi:hypothetical protein